jgi:NADH:ubiquinone oxidoreductase subunit F (NADH-binding)
MGGASEEADAPVTLVDNVETLAHVTVALAEGADWFREVGTDDSPGTFLATVSGCTVRAGVGEFTMGTPVREVIETLGGGVPAGRTIRAVLQGAASAIMTADQLDTPASWEAMQAIGSGLGSASFIVVDDATDITGVAASVSRFLTIESCGQCTPCKQDSALITDALVNIAGPQGTKEDVGVVLKRIETVTFGARCSLATQEQLVIGSILDAFGDEIEARVEHTHHGGEPMAIVPMLDLRGGVATLDVEHAQKQPDWTFNEHWSGKAPADRLDDHRSHHEDL